MEAADLQPMSEREIRDREWACKIRRGDRPAFEALFRCYYSSLCDFAYTLVRSGGDAESLVQDVFLSIWERRQAWRPKGAVAAYLYRAVRNRAYNTVSSRRAARTWYAGDLLEDLSTLHSEEKPEDDLRFQELRVLADRVLQSLPERRRMVFVLSRQHGMTYAEIATIMGISVKTVEAQMSQALQCFRDRLGPFLFRQTNGVEG